MILSTAIKWSPLEHFAEQTTLIILIFQSGSVITEMLSAVQMSGIICKILSVSSRHTEGLMKEKWNGSYIKWVETSLHEMIMGKECCYHNNNFVT